MTAMPEGVCAHMTTDTMADLPGPEQFAELRARLAEAEETLRAIRSAEVDAITVSTPSGERVYSLRGAEQPYREMIEAMSEGAVNITHDGIVLYCNQYFARLAKADPNTIMGSRLLVYFAQRDRARITRALEDSRFGTSSRLRANLLAADGEFVPVNVALHILADEDIRSIVIVTSDLTQIVAAQEATTRVNVQPERANRALHMLNVCNTTIIHASDEKQVLADTCRALVDSGDYRLAWIGYADENDAVPIRPVAWADATPGDVGSRLLPWSDDRLRPAGTAIRAGSMTVVRDTDTEASLGPWRDMAQQGGFRSAATIPLRAGAGVMGVLMIYSSLLDAFDEQESATLVELSDDVAYCVTNLRREQRLTETRAILDSVLESSTKYSIISQDLDRRVLFWNEGARRNYGYAAEEITGRTQDILHTPEDRASGAVARLVESARDKGIAEGEFERVRKDGTRFPAEIVVTRRDDASGNPIGYLVISSDISERRRAEEQVRVAAQYARSLIEASLDPLMTISPDGKITDVNHATELVTGQTREHLIGSDFAVYFTEPEKARAGYRRVFTKGFVIDYPLAIRHVTGLVTEVLCNASLYRDANDEVAGVFAAARDISRIPPAELIPRPKSRRRLWHYVGFAIAAIVFLIAATAVPIVLRSWLQELQEQSSILRSTGTNSRMQRLLLEVTPTPARARAAQVQMQPGTDAELGYTPIYSVATSNHNPGVIGRESSISRFADEMPALLNGNCAHLNQQLTNQTPNLSDFIVCPMIGKSHRLIGLLLLSWDQGDQTPANFDPAIAATRQAAIDIAAIWTGNR
jgi:PAS domain S-box-containing protein